MVFSMSSVQLPDIVDYVEFFKFSESKSLFDKRYCYILEPYDVNNGITLYIGFRKDGNSVNVLTRVADFKSNTFNLMSLNNKHISNLMEKYHNKLVNILKTAGVLDSLMYFSIVKDELLLVDVMINANQFLSPGLLRDLFGKVLPIQKTVTIDIITAELVKNYKGKFIKPSAFKYVLDSETPRPMYGIIDEV